jgi:hypothetical protein
MARHFKQGRYIPRYPEKYIGKRLANGMPDIVYRSSWEKRAFIFLDLNESVISWNSEDIVIPYHYPIDNKMHRYHVDLLATFKTVDGGTKTLLMEIKPYVETLPPKQPKRKTEKSMMNYQRAIETYIKNQSKWQAAKEFANNNGIEFIVLTENELFGKVKEK